jgi:hypothetical protein
MYGIVFNKKGNNFPDMARDNNMRAYSFDTLEAAKDFAAQQKDWKSFNIVLITSFRRFPMEVMGVSKYKAD